MDGCCAPVRMKAGRFRKVVWIALLVNFGMFVYEFGAGFSAQSQSLKADALDFLGDSANYGIGLFVLSRALRTRAFTSLVKGVTMGGFGLWVVGASLWSLAHGASPNSETMGRVGLLALIANVVVAVLLYEFREGDSNMKSVWLCSRNDAVGNVAVMIAAGVVSLTGSMWPDIVVALLMAFLALDASLRVVRAALREMSRREPAILEPGAGAGR